MTMASETSAPVETTNTALQVTDLIKQFGGGRSLLGRPLPAVHAVRGLSFEVRPGEILGIVGESGCGKSTVARMLVGLESPTEGRITLREEPLAEPGKPIRRTVLARKIQYVFQDPISSLNPRKTIREILSAPLYYLRGMTEKQRTERLKELMAAVNLRPEFLHRYPHEFSGGQAQRIGIARALAAEPEVLVLDEPVSALDVSVQAQVLNLLQDLRREFNLTYVFISHDLGVVRNLCDRVAVMYFGRIVETGPTRALFDNPQHHYTRLLLDSVPGARDGTLPDEEVNAELPDPFHPPTGCAFAPRCSAASDQCRQSDPELDTRRQDGQQVACYHPAGESPA
ncbi:MAG: ATP-binding cassette domain-containing protein [Natronospirillum sp.]|uniref:ABC transporter ATP-binding protein n=1 Tax=Natronospirillum sp. TaxID=2812955 RepID=UPI0025DFBD74|nr:oligopeptide/dipeptide ABC transporter ATP-binding protein [Natronospirillum sp.]MCH8553410.1 ATP-binding cassette domain-containing protein [Natronospirillum sp.]